MPGAALRVIHRTGDHDRAIATRNTTSLPDRGINVADSWTFPAGEPASRTLLDLALIVQAELGARTVDAYLAERFPDYDPRWHRETAGVS
jgi:hypothetical protein